MLYKLSVKWPKQEGSTTLKFWETRNHFWNCASSELVVVTASNDIALICSENMGKIIQTK